MSKQIIIDALVKSGMTPTDAEATYNAAAPKAQVDADVMRENEMLKARVKVREDQLTQAISIANKANEQQTIRDEAARQDLVDRIVVDSSRKWTADELKDKSLTELKLIHTSIQKSYDATFASVAALQAEQDRHKPLFSAGYYDSASGTWKGGIAK